LSQDTKCFISVTRSQVLIVKGLSSFLGMDTAGIRILIDYFFNIDEISLNSIFCLSVHCPL